ncbi:GNAT family protein [Paucibacter sp. PLA-PC-4]|uniref:GNAT family N-acetyltransferase n=1 Tax=Paucibacter sp. PLA-PC-4 TaxID=2993655 RepID=UPI00224B2D3D|nr:GNAT family protein [Paucibacter sp. PLA-PC-4]MCX2863744.1 GNAT family protein [Paucibacter sp. PLA-PC-4]
MANTEAAAICTPVTLGGHHATLAPLALEHEAGLQAAVREGELWQLWYTAIPTPEGMGAEIRRRLDLQAKQSMLPFTVFDAGQRIVGMTTFMNIDNANRRVEIGSTWYGNSVQRSPLNTECKLMLLTHAFETLDCIAVEFRTHRFNSASRRAIERLGAQLDGVLRAHMRASNGTLRDTAVYSITATEWPTVKTHLQWQLAKPR